MHKVRYVVIDLEKKHKDGVTRGFVFLRNKAGKILKSFEYANYKDWNEIKKEAIKFNEEAQKIIDDKKQGRLF